MHAMEQVWASLGVAVLLAACNAPGPVGSADGGTATGMVAVADGRSVATEGRDVLRLGTVCDPCGAVDLSLSLSEADAALVERLFVTVSWDGARTSGFAASARGADDVRRGHDAVRLTFEAPLEPAYRIEVDGAGAHDLTARLVFLDGDGGRLLPDLVTPTPGAFWIPRGDPWGEGESFVDGCTAFEREEHGATRCLRFGNAPANVGVGVLEVRLETGGRGADAAGRYVQRIHHADGSFEELPAAGGTYHVEHGHFHYDGFSHYRLHAFDPDTGLRGEPVGAGHKVGFCPADRGRMFDSENGPTDRAYPDVSCREPTSVEWVMGVSPGWYDLYASTFEDQYVEVGGLPDGVYQLVATVDADGTLVEADAGNNAASVVLRLAGDEVEVLERYGFYAEVPTSY